MRCLKFIAFYLLPLVMFSLTGCGSGSSGTANSPFSNSGSGSSNPIFGNISSASGVTGITLTLDHTTVDANNGQVLATAKLLNNSAAVGGVAVSFSIFAPVNGPATVEPGLATVTTDSSGTAVTRITTGNTLTTTNVVVKATATIAGKTAISYATFQIVRGTGVITFITAAGSTDPSGTLVTLSTSVASDFAGTLWTFNQLLPFKVTDSNGNPRVGVPVTLSIFSQLNNLATSAPVPQTVSTDSSGRAIFNVGVTMAAPSSVGVTLTDSIVYQAVTNDTIPLTAYGGFIASITTLNTTTTPLIIVPQTANFSAGDAVGATISFTISGGAAPYNVTSSNSTRVSVALQADGVTAIATLRDASLWTGNISISAKDKIGQTATATVLRQ